MALPNGTPVDAPSPEPRPDVAPSGRRYTTTEGLALELDYVREHLREITANLRTHPPRDESADLTRIAVVAENVRRAVTTLDHALAWREGR